LILQVSPASSGLVRGAAATLLFFHITAGGVALRAGAAALLLRKGSPRHRMAGNVFFVAVLIMAAIGACVAPILPDRGSSLAGAFTLYLVATAWATVRRQEYRVGWFEIGALLFALGLVATGISLGREGAQSPGGLIDGQQSAETAYAFAVLAALAAIGDLKMLVRHGIYGARRIARHLWRMCFALLIAAGSFFLGQQQVFPAALHGSLVLFVPVLAVMALMIFWLCRVWLTRARWQGEGTNASSPLTWKRVRHDSLGSERSSNVR
jgi:hypothetical protein